MGIIKLIADIDPIIEHLSDPELADRIKEDGQPDIDKQELAISMLSGGQVLGFVVDGDIKGLFWIHQFTYGIIQAHALFLMENRIYSKGSGSMLTKWIKKNSDQHIKKIISMVPRCYPEVIGFCSREGMEQIGIMKECYNKKGKLQDLVIMGVDR